MTLKVYGSPPDRLPRMSIRTLLGRRRIRTLADLHQQADDVVIDAEEATDDFHAYATIDGAWTMFSLHGDPADDNARIERHRVLIRK